MTVVWMTEPDVAEALSAVKGRSKVIEHNGRPGYILLGIRFQRVPNGLVSVVTDLGPGFWVPADWKPGL